MLLNVYGQSPCFCTRKHMLQELHQRQCCPAQATARPHAGERAGPYRLVTSDVPWGSSAAALHNKCPHLQLWPGQNTCLRAKGWELRCTEDNNVPNMQGIQTGLFLCLHMWLQTCQPHCSQLRLHKAEEQALVLELELGCCPREKSSCAFTCTWGITYSFFSAWFLSSEVLLFPHEHEHQVWPKAPGTLRGDNWLHVHMPLPTDTALYGLCLCRSRHKPWIRIWVGH